MLLRVSIVIDRELTDQRALEEYGTLDPYSVITQMQVEADKLGESMKAEGLNVVGVKVDVRNG